MKTASGITSKTTDTAMLAPNLSLYDNSGYAPGRSRLIRGLWFLFGLPLLRSQLNPFSSARALLLRLFGAKIALGVVLKPGIRVKYPWLLSVGAHSWIGEDTWIDNLAHVRIGSNACISQGAYICTGNHNWADPAFGLIVEPVVLGDGSWVGARAMICPGISLGECAIAAAGSVVMKCIPAFEIHAGNPAHLVRKRRIGETADSLRYAVDSSRLSEFV